jgi:hypothetical protein
LRTALDISCLRTRSVAASTGAGRRGAARGLAAVEAPAAAVRLGGGGGAAGSSVSVMVVRLRLPSGVISLMVMRVTFFTTSGSFLAVGVLGLEEGGL